MSRQDNDLIHRRDRQHAYCIAARETTEIRGIQNKNKGSLKKQTKSIQIYIHMHIWREIECNYFSLF